MMCALEKGTLMKVQAGTEHVVCRSIDAQAMSSICKCRARRGRPSNLGGSIPNEQLGTHEKLSWCVWRGGGLHDKLNNSI